MDFDEALGKEGAGIGVWIHNPINQSLNIPPNVWMFSYKITFNFSNNEAEYKALITGLKILKKLGAKKIYSYGDSELVIKQFKGEYQAKNPRMWDYLNSVLDILKIFSEYTLSLIPRDSNIIADFVATSTSMFKIPLYPNKKYRINVKHRPIFPDNVQYWK